MTRAGPSPRQVAASLGPLAAAGIGAALAAAAELPASAPRPPELLAAALLAVGATAGLHRPLGGRSPGLGAVSLPMLCLFFGPLWAGAAASSGSALREAVWRRPGSHRRAPAALAIVAGAGGSALAAVLGATAWRLSGGGVWPAGAAAGAAYLLALASWSALDRGLGGSGLGAAGRRGLACLLLDALGWGYGLGAAAAALALGWPVGLVLLAGAALLGWEAARNARLRRRAEGRLEGLREVTQAGRRMVPRDFEMASLAENVFAECRRVVPCRWLQFELLGPGEGEASWWAGPDGRIREGAPEPPRRPPALPGIHRRFPWKVLERELEADGSPVARLRLWCDPRRLPAGAVDLLENLLPQLGSSVQRALLDREAKRDPLTGVAARRVLEARLPQAFQRACEEGRPLAVVMCDLDHFKRINDTHGHGAGDRALVAVAGLLEDHRRATDLYCRYGGEEFTLLLEDTDGDEALKIAERLRSAVAEFELRVDGRRIPLSLSAGVAAFPELFVRTGEELVILADGALYEAKRRGRNRCLLDLGRGRFREAGGKVVESEDSPPKPSPPTVFA